MSEDNGNRLLTAKQVAEMLQISEGWVHEAARNGDLPYIALGRYKRFRQHEVEEWVESKAHRGRS